MLLISLIDISFLIYCYVEAQQWAILPAKKPSHAAIINNVSLIQTATTILLAVTA